MTQRLLIASGIFHPQLGGPATYLYELLPALQQRGWDPQVISYGDAPTAGYPYPLTRIPMRSLPLRMADYARKAAPLLRWADLVYIHSLGLPLLPARSPHIIKIVGDQAWERAIRRGWIPPTTDIDTFQQSSDSGFLGMQKRRRSREVRRAQRVIVPSAYLRQMVLGWGVEPEKVHLIYNALPSEPENVPPT